MTDYPQWPFELSQISRSDRSLRELFGAAYYPALVLEGEPASSDRQAFVSSAFGDIFDVLVATMSAANTAKAANSPADAINAYRAVIVGGSIDLSGDWARRLSDYVRKGGVVVVNAAQAKGLPADLVGVRALGSQSETNSARCLVKGEPAQDLTGQIFRYERVSATGSEVMIETASGDPLVTINKFGQGKLIYCALPDLLGEDERITPFAVHLLAHVFASATPMSVTGDVEHLINRTERGWL